MSVLWAPCLQNVLLQQSTKVYLSDHFGGLDNPAIILEESPVTTPVYWPFFRDNLSKEAQKSN